MYSGWKCYSPPVLTRVCTCVVTLTEHEHQVRVSGWWPLLLGVLAVVVAMREIFIDLFQPSGSGTLSSYVGRWMFQLARKLKFLLGVAGPLALVIAMSCWTFLLASGFALMYSSSSPDPFSLQGEPGR